MRYVTAFRDGPSARALAQVIGTEVDAKRSYRYMEFCGGHTHAIYRHGVLDLLPKQIEMIHGPGCPVCVLPQARVDAAIALAEQPGHVLCAFGDSLRVPGSRRDSLLKAKARGADVRLVVSSFDALAIAQREPDKRVVFFAVGFETTAPGTALAILQAEAAQTANFRVLCNHVLTTPALDSILDAPVAIDGFIGPAHVSTVIGAGAYEQFVRERRRPLVVAGFEPLDVLHALVMLVRQSNARRAEVENQYTRAVTREGSAKAQALLAQVFETRDTFAWRGLGDIPNSGLRLRAAYARFDAERELPPERAPTEDHPACKCASILRGLNGPFDCKLFAKACTPANAIGPCMVSSEGACAAAYTYGRHRAPAGASGA